MVQRMHGREVADDNEVGCTGDQAGGDVDRRIVGRARATLRAGDTFNTCCLFQTQPFPPRVLSSSFRGLAVILRG